MKIFLAFFLAAAVLPVRAFADACDGDRGSVCGDVTPGEGRVFDCLKGRIDKLSPECANAAGRAEQLATTMISACQQEAYKWCAQYINEGRDTTLDCLKSHKDEVAASCKRAYRQLKAFGEFDFKS